MFLQKNVSFSLDKQAGVWYNMRVVTGLIACTNPTIQRQQVPVKRGRKASFLPRRSYKRKPWDTAVCLCESFSVKHALREKDFFFCPLFVKRTHKFTGR